MNFSFQLYSARSLAPLSAIFPQLKALGYAQVEGFGGLYAQADELAAALKSSGLNMPTAHFDLDQLKDISTTLKTARTLGIKTLICPAIPAGPPGSVLNPLMAGRSWLIRWPNLAISIKGRGLNLAGTIMILSSLQPLAVSCRWT